MIIGKSGSGKSTSLRNFKENEVGVFNVAGKPLPFKGKLKKVDHPDYQTIIGSLKANGRRAYVIDDSTYLMQFDNFNRAKDTGYAKFTDMAISFEKLLEAAIKTDENTIVYFLHHPDKADDGSIKPKSIGKMLDEKLCIEGLFPIVLECEMRDGKYSFVSRNDGSGIAKAPMGMLPDVIDNDLKAVDTAIREYWELGPLVDKPAEGTAKSDA
jgi:hypothetical protein